MPVQAEIRLDTKVLDRLTAEMAYKAEQIVTKIAFDVEAGAKTRAPVDTGALKASIYTSTRRSSTYRDHTGDAFLANPDARIAPEVEAPHRLEAVVAAPMEYAVYVELGTSKMGAQPFLGPAVEAVRRAATAAWAALFR